MNITKRITGFAFIQLVETKGVLAFFSPPSVLMFRVEQYSREKKGKASTGR